MNKRSFLLLGVLTLTLAFATVSASAQGPTVMSVEIPFEFVIGKRTLPAGRYDVKLRETSGNPIVSVRSSDGDNFGLALANTFDSGKANAESGLTFVKSGGTHYLFQILVEGRETGTEVLKTRRLAGTELARKVVTIKPAKS